MRRLWRDLLSLGFRLLYNEFAWTYDAVAWLVSLGQWRAWGCESLAHLQGRRVLELGHGPGHLLAEMAGRGLTPVGVDESVQMGRLARRMLRKRAVAAPLVRARAQQLPFCDAAFDSVVATFPTEFILERATLQQAERVLGDGGRLVVVANVVFEGGRLAARLLRWVYGVTGQSEALPHGSSRLREAGFAPVARRVSVGRCEVLLRVGQK